MAQKRRIILLYVSFLLICLLLMQLFTKEAIHIFINQHNNTIADVFFKYVTHLGDGLFNIAIFAILLFVRFRWALMVFFSGIPTLIIVWLMKQKLYHGVMRPLKYFEGTYDLHFVKGIDIHEINSFPSGHTAGAFSLFLLFALISDNSKKQYLFLAIAILVGYSRMYLSQHFLVDVAMGAFIGGIISLIVFYIFETSLKNKLNGALSIPMRKKQPANELK